MIAARVDELVVWPVSEEPALASDKELVLPRNVLGFEAVLHEPLAGSLLPEQLDEWVGSVTEVERSSAAMGAPVLTETDPRIGLTIEMTERWLPYFEPAMSLALTSTVGELVALRRTESGLSVSDLARDTHMPEQTIAELEDDEIPLVPRVPPRALAALLRRLAVIPSLRLATRLRQTALASMPSDHLAAPAYRHGSSRAQSANRGRADAYATEVMRLMAHPAGDKGSDD